MTSPLPTPLAAVEAMARAIEGPHRPVPEGSKFTLDELREVRWKMLNRGEQAARLNEARSALALYPGVAEVIAGSAVVVPREKLREFFEAGVTQGSDEAVAFEWGSRPSQRRDEAYQDALYEIAPPAPGAEGGG